MGRGRHVIRRPGYANPGCGSATHPAEGSGALVMPTPVGGSAAPALPRWSGLIFMKAAARRHRRRQWRIGYANPGRRLGRRLRESFLTPLQSLDTIPASTNLSPSLRGLYGVAFKLILREHLNRAGGRAAVPPDSLPATFGGGHPGCGSATPALLKSTFDALLNATWY